MDDDTRKIGMLIAAFDAEHERLKIAILGLQRVGGQLAGEVGSAAQGAVTKALSQLNTDVEKASRTLIDLQGLSLWRAALQHAVVAVVAIATTLLAVWWYVPPAAEIADRRAERDQLQASIDELVAKGGRLKTSVCGDQKRLCVMISNRATTWASVQNKDQVYVIPVGY
jgi:hypothetical protein